MKYNNPTSVEVKLKEIYGSNNYQKTCYRYLIEGILLRLSLLAYKNKFYLKGGAFLYAVNRDIVRPTKDADFLGEGIPNDMEVQKEIWTEILDIETDEDALFFDTTTIRTQNITEQKQYHGVRILTDVYFNGTKTKFYGQIDIGFGDIVTPKVETIQYPRLLKVDETITVLAYNIETVVAEKFETMIKNDIVNSRMKDFYDVYNILKKGDFDKEILREAIQNTFSNRQTSLKKDHVLFQPEFVTKKTKDWLNEFEKFDAKSLSKDITFAQVMDVIKEHLIQYAT